MPCPIWQESLCYPLMVALADLPDWLLDLWIALDRGGENFSTDEPANIGKPLNSASAAAPPSDLLPPQPHKRSQARPAPRHTNKQELLKTGVRARTTVLSAENGYKYRGTFAYGCALHLSRLLGQPGVWIENKHTFSCLLPGHRESTPSARWVWQADGSLLYHDMHVRTEQRMYWAVPEVYAAFITGKLVSFKKHKPSMKTWSIRLAIDAGLIEPYPLPKPTVPADAPPRVQTLCQGVWLLLACKWTYEAEKATMLAPTFLEGWCGIPAGSVWLTMQWVLSRRMLMHAGYEQRCPVYLPGEEWHR
jgi:hypothetical protein